MTLTRSARILDRFAKKRGSLIMPNHPNRGQGQAHTRHRNPAPDAITRFRERMGLTQTQAADLVHTTCRVWQQWEAGDRRMHPAFWDLFQRKAKAS